MYFKAPDTVNRLAAALLDQVFAFILKMLAFAPLFMSMGGFSSYSIPSKNPLLVFLEPQFIISFISLSSVYYLKDVFDGRGPGKRMMGLQIVDSFSGKTASPVKTVLRSFGNLLWPLECIMAIANPARRSGDFIAGTRLSEYVPKEKATFPFHHHLLAIVLAIIVAATTYLPLMALGSMAANVPVSAPPPEYRTEEVKEEPLQTENLINFFKEKYSNECESVLLSSQAVDGQNGSIINGSFILKRDLFANGEAENLKEKIKNDFKEQLSGKTYTVDVSIVYMGEETPQQLKLQFSSRE